MVVIGPGLGTTLMIEKRHIKRLDAIYNKSRKGAAKAIDVAKKETSQFVIEVRREYEEQQKEASSPSSPPQESDNPPEK